MADKKLTVEELEQKVENAKKAFDSLNEQLQKQKKEEEEKRLSELALVKEVRQKEVEDALNNYTKLLKEFVKDYGAISISNKGDWFPFFHNGNYHWWF